MKYSKEVVVAAAVPLINIANARIKQGGLVYTHTIC